MILRALYQYAVEEELVASMEVKDRLVDLFLNIRPDGSVSEAAPWMPRYREMEAPRGKPSRQELGLPLPMPEYPGVNAGGKAYFLVDASDKVLGVFGKTGEPIPDDSARGGNATKAFLHFWQRISDAHDTTKLPELAALVAFRDRYLATEDDRRRLPFAGMAPTGKDGKHAFCALGLDPPIPLEGRTITFSVGAGGGPIFARGTPLHDYWKTAFQRERFVSAPAGPAAGAARGTCLVTGQSDQPIAEVHRTLIKGVPGLPPIGGYVVSFDKSSPAFTSYGFEAGWNAPVSENAAAGYALALNHILADRLRSRRFGGAVLASWIGGDHELTGTFNNVLLDAQPLEGEVQEFFRAFEAGGKYHGSLDTRHYHSITLAANGGRVVIRRWLDEPLRAAVASLKRWFADLETIAIDVPGARGKATDAPPPLSIYALAATTARVPSEVPDGVYDALYRAALEGFQPLALLSPLLQRIRIIAAQAGDGLRFKTSHFALLKLILIRSQESPMEITPRLCETSDPAYNCGRLLALLDDIQSEAQGDVGADIVARFYGNASTFPRNVFQRLLRLEKHHRVKLLKHEKPFKRAAGVALGRRIDEVCSRFRAAGPGFAPEFPGLLSPQEQGRFALGFHQQKAQSEAERREFLARRATETEALEPAAQD